MKEEHLNRSSPHFESVLRLFIDDKLIFFLIDGKSVIGKIHTYDNSMIVVHAEERKFSSSTCYPVIIPISSIVTIKVNT